LGNPGDYYLNDDTGEAYRKRDDTTWEVVATIKGEDGINGTDGTDGSDGSDGSVWHTGQGDPADDLGNNGDFYLNSASGDYYRKQGGHWMPEGNLKGPKGDPGEDGQDGSDAEGGLEENLNRIVALSWTHAGNGFFTAEVLLDVGAGTLPGVVIGFERDVKTDTIDAEHVLHVLAPIPYPPPSPEDNNVPPYRCWCPLYGEVYPVEITQSVTADDQELIIQAKVIDSDIARAVAFVPYEKTELYDALHSGRQPIHLFVRLRCDFVLDDRHGTAVDGEFICGKLPTGDRITGRKGGLQGGLFESWFTTNGRHGDADVTKVDINVADAPTISAIDGISDTTALHIVEARSEGRYDSIEDLVTRGIMTPQQLGRVREFLKVE
jgi:hypothetical protein